MNYMIANKCSYTSARILSGLLGLKVTSRPEVILKNPVNKLLIRYGCSLPVFKEDLAINSAESIKLSSNSVIFSDFCEENDFNSPKYIDPQKINLEEVELPVLLRKKYHSQGRDIIYVDDFQQLKENIFGRFIVNFIPTSDEIGIHVVNGDVVKVFKKVPLENAHPFIRNLHNGYHFRLINHEENYRVAQSIAIDLMNKMGLTFGRVDIGYIRDKRKYVIWEVNSAPGLNPQTAKLYAERLIPLLKI